MATPALGLALALTTAAAAQASSGAAQAPSAPRSGGSEYGVVAAPATVERPLVGLLSVPASATPGAPPPVHLRIEEPGQSTVNVRVTITSLATRRPVLVVSLGWVRTGRTVSVRWPAGSRLTAGSYHVSLVARDSHSAPLLRRAHASGVARLVVAAPAPAPVPVPAQPPSAPASTPPGVPTPAQLAADGAVFPVAGPHNFGGPENRFGAPRNGYTHQGQDILTSEGTPVVAPLAGTILTTGYQAGGAGYYAAEHTTSGFDFFFAHCTAGSLAVVKEQSVSAGQTLCNAGQTGDATTPHLHFEMWVGGWRSEAGYPIDPLPYLEAIEHSGSSG
ncbi:MAG TPA: M23 family metallopeptidase [Solirubrobacteraceae bacterium]|nr:M23 family metallopeptidase [Solirubrobacteraceae bacterium]